MSIEQPVSNRYNKLLATEGRHLILALAKAVQLYSNIKDHHETRIQAKNFIKINFNMS